MAAMLTEFAENADDLGSRLANWRKDKSVARITWADAGGAEHLCVVTDERWGHELVDAIAREPGYRLVSCVVE